MNNKVVHNVLQESLNLFLSETHVFITVNILILLANRHVNECHFTAVYKTYYFYLV